MSFLAQIAPPAPSSVHVGLRALVHCSHRQLPKVVAPGTCRHFHTPSNSPRLSTSHDNRRPDSSQQQQWASPMSWLSSQSRNRSLPCHNILLPRTQIRTIFRFRAITHYSKLPLDYEDAQGIPFRKEDLNQREVNQIFGAHLKAKSANNLLRIIHGRRVAGTLEDPDLQINTAQYKSDDKIKALMYLRRHIPLDEVVMAGLRAEDELKAIEEQEAVRAEAKSSGGNGTNEEAEHQHEETSTQIRPSGRIPGRTAATTDSPYGVGHFDRIRAANIARREAEEKRLEAERLAREAEEAVGISGVPQKEMAKPREVSPWMQKQVERATSTLQEPPKMSAWQRLWPMLATTVAICTVAALFAINYQPPRKSERMFPEIPPAAATCLTLVALNVGVWAMWKMPPMWRMLNRYFLVVAATPKPAQLLFATFSHQTFSHVGLNMATLWFFGTRLHDQIGRGDFLALYFSCGAVGFMASLADLVLRRGLQYTTHGASGAVYGMIVAYFWMHKFDEFKIFNYPPDPTSGPPGLAFIGLIVGLHIAGLLSKRGHLNDLTSHLGGMLMGVAGMEIIQRYSEFKARMRMQRMQSGSLMNPEKAQKINGGSK